MSSSSSIVDLCMKELLMQQKLGLEFQFQQHQQNAAPSPLAFFHSPSSPSAVILSPPSPAASSSLFPSIAAPPPPPLPLFHRNTTFVQQCPPPTLFDPLAAAVAANFMQHFSQPHHHHLPHHPFPTSFSPSMAIFGGAGQRMMPPPPPHQMQNALFGFPFPDFTQSPSLNSTGSCASLDSFPSSGLPSSPDSSSNSSLHNGGPPFPLIGSNGRRQAKYRPIGRMAGAGWAGKEGEEGKSAMTPAVPTDFSELAAFAGTKQPAPLQTTTTSSSNKPGGGGGGQPKVSSKMASSTTTVQQHQRICPKLNQNKKRPSQNAPPLAGNVRPKIGSQKRSSAEGENPANGQQGGEPPKKVARKLGTTIFVPLKEFAAVNKQQQRPLLTSSMPSLARDESAGETAEEIAYGGQRRKLAVITAPATSTTGEGEEEGGINKINGANGGEAREMMAHGEGEPLLMAMPALDLNEDAGEMWTNKNGEQEGQTPPEVDLNRVKCELLFKLEEEQQQMMVDGDGDGTFFLPDSPPILTMEKENEEKKMMKKRKIEGNLEESKGRRKEEGKKERMKKIKSNQMKRAKKEEEEGEERKKNGERGSGPSEEGIIAMSKDDMEDGEEEKEGAKNAPKEAEEDEQFEEVKLEVELPPSTTIGGEAKLEGNAIEKGEEGKKEGTEEEEEEDDEEEEGGDGERDEKEEVEDEEEEGKRERKVVACRWTKCKERFMDDDQLYDHIATAHVEPLKKWVLAEQRELEQQRKAGLKRRRSSGAADKGIVKERFRCKWRKCEQFPRRGDAQKKLDWLQKHLVIRHAPKARPYCCIFAGCPLRFPKLETLHDHLRSAHDDNNGRNNGRKNGTADEAKATKITCFEFRPRVHLPILHDCIDARTVEWMRSRLNDEPFAAFGDQSHKTNGELGPILMERAKARKSSRSCSPREGTTKLALKLCQALEICQEAKAEDGKLMEIKNEPRGSQPRMPMHEAIGHLKGLFGKMSRR